MDDLQSSNLRLKSNDTAAGISVLLASLAIVIAMWSLWIVYSTYERYSGRTDLDMPDWFVINMDLSGKVLQYTLGSALCLLVSGGLFPVWAGRAGWTMRIGFGVHWLVSATIVGVLVVSRIN